MTANLPRAPFYAGQQLGSNAPFSEWDRHPDVPTVNEDDGVFIVPVPKVPKLLNQVTEDHCFSPHTTK